MLRHGSDIVPSAGAAVRLVVRWDRETGWAHVATVVPGTGRTRFTGFHQFAGGDPAAVVAELVASGCVTTSQPRRDDDLMEVHAVFAWQEVTADAAR
ncbi:hypothetical protein [Actinophytocola glycyrrhizae]|uniref:Uncharacterized protein n=1 Tax=Actinophytocola glycyrrhizae TaxID=2044873 RepID=A0ABV9RZJ8_9PSEU